jgi:hypothetical protein
MERHTVLLTGIQRSGTTLACRLLNQLPDCVALLEPLEVMKLPGFPGWRTRRAVRLQAAALRKGLLETGRAWSKQREGEVPDNCFDDELRPDGLRRTQVERGWMQVQKPLSRDFLLVIKHPAAFTALLPVLRKGFEMFAMVRNPLAVTASWSTCDMEARFGHAPAAEKFDPALRKKLAAIPDPLERQVELVDWYFDQYLKFLPPERILKYEELVAQRGRPLAVLAPAAKELDEPLASRNQNTVYSGVPWEPLRKLLVERRRVCHALYTPAEIEAAAPSA